MVQALIHIPKLFFTGSRFLPDKNSDQQETHELNWLKPEN